MTDFDRIFDPKYTAVDLFTDRRAENETFASAFASHRERVAEGIATLASTPRRNVLTFYGIGGIGKTALSLRLERWLLGERTASAGWGGPPPLDPRLATVRIDFHGSATVNAADIVLRLRAAVASSPRRYPAFDLGLAAWWSLARPGTELPELRSRQGFDVRGQISDTVGDLLGDVGGIGALGVRLAARLIDAVRTRRLRDKTLRDCAPLRTVVDEARVDPSSYVAATLAGLLSWDVERQPASERPVAVVFADAVEYVQGGSRTQERLLNRIVHLTPGFLWVVTSRNSLDWDSPTLNRVLPATGPQVWPGLSFEAQPEPRQHLVGDLADADVERYLATASGTAGNPDLGAEVIDRIRRGAHGLPLYLDLSMAVARTAAVADGELDPSAFGGPLPELVTHVFADLPEAEREIARTASLVPRFAPAVVAQAAGRLVGDAQRFCRRALVTEDDHPMFPYRLHDAVRSAIVNEPVAGPGAWAVADREARAERLIDVLHEQHNQVIDDVDRRRDVLELTAGLCAAHDFEVPWVFNALLDLPNMARTAERLPSPDRHTWMGQVWRFFDAHRNNLDDRIDHLERLVAEPLSPDIRATAWRFLAYWHRETQFSISTVGSADRALTILRTRLSERPDSQLLRYELAQTLCIIEDFDGLAAHLTRYPLNHPAGELQLQSNMAYYRGDVEDAVAAARASIAYRRSVGHHRIAQERQFVALWRAALIDRTTVAECDAAIAEANLSGYGMKGIIRTPIMAKAICLAGDEEAVHALVMEAMSVIDATAGHSGWREWSALLVHGLRRSDHNLIRQVHEQWTAAPRHPNYNYRVVDRLLVYAGYPSAYPPLRMGDGTDPVTIDRRWHKVIDALVNGC